MNRWPVKSEYLTIDTVWYMLVYNIMKQNNLFKSKYIPTRSNADIRLLKTIFRTYGINPIFKRTMATSYGVSPSDEIRSKIVYLCFRSEEEKTFWLLQTTKKPE